MKSRNEFIGKTLGTSKSRLQHLRNPAGVNPNLAFNVRGLESNQWCVFARLVCLSVHACVRACVSL